MKDIFSLSEHVTISCALLTVVTELCRLPNELSTTASRKHSWLAFGPREDELLTTKGMAQATE